MTNAQHGRGPLTRQQMRVAAAGVVSLLTFAGLLTVPMPAQAEAPPVTLPQATASSTTTSTTGPTTTTTVANQTGIISRSDSPPPAGAPGPAGPDAPQAPAPEPPPPSAPATAILSLGAAPEALQPPPATPPPPPQVVLRAPAAGSRTPVLSSPRQVPAVLEAAAARRRELNARVVEAEAKVVALESEVSSADAALASLRSQVQSLATRLEGAQGRALYQEQASLAPPAPVAPPAPQPKAAKAAKGAVAAVWDKAVDLGRAILPDPPASAVIVADGVREREDALRRQSQLSASAASLARQLDQLQGRAAYAEAALAPRAAELSEARRSLAEARTALSAAMADVAFGPQALGTALGSGTSEASRFALADIPPDYLNLYKSAAEACPGLSWTVLAAVGSTESAHGRTAAPGVRDGANFAGAMGPMQFLAPTWAAYGLDGGGDGVADVYDPADAVFGASNYLCANGAGDPARLAGAIWAYNHADWYVRGVLDLAIRYGAAGLHATGVDAASLLGNPNLTMGPQAAADLAAGRVDRRVMEALAAMAAGHRISLGVIETGHAMYVKGSDRVSNHYYGRAVDIYEVDGAPVTSANDAAMELAVALLTADASIRPDELGSPWPELGRFPGAFTDAEHMDHLHLGWTANGATAPTTEEP